MTEVKRSTWRRMAVVLLVIIAAAANGARRVREDRTNPTIELRNEFWAAHTGQRAQLFGPPGDGFRLHRDEYVQLVVFDDDTIALREFAFRLESVPDPAATIDIRFRDGGSGAYRLVLTPGASISGSLSAPSARGYADIATGSVRRAKPDLAAPFEVRVRLKGPAFEVSIDGKLLLSARDERLPHGSVSLRATDARVFGLSIDAVTFGARGEAKPFVRSDDLEFVRAGIPITRSVGHALLEAAIAFLAVLAFLFALSGDAPSPLRLARAASCALVPLALVTIGCEAAHATPPTALIVAALALGMPVGFFVLRDVLRAPPRRLALRLGVAALVLATGATIWIDREVTIVSTARTAKAGAIAAAAGTLAKQGATLDAPLTLDAGNNDFAAGPYRDLEIRGTVVLRPDSVLEVRMRAHLRLAEGIALFLSCHREFETGFVLEHSAEFRAIGSSSPALAPDVPHELRIRATGSVFEAFVDGRSIARADDDTYVAGTVFALAPCGRVDLQSFAIEPLPPAADASSSTLQVALTHCAGLALIIPLVLALVALLRRPVVQILGGVAFCLVPLATTLRTDTGGLFDFVVVSFEVVLVLLAIPTFQAHAVGAWRTVVAALCVTAIGPLLVASTGAFAFEPILGADPSLERFDGPRLRRGQVQLTAPILRQFHTYLADHRFRGRAFSTTKTPGVVRIMCLGSSSTWGSGLSDTSALDYPTQLETMLTQRGLRVEVMNAGIRASNSTRTRYVFEEALLPAFRPDIVTVSFFFNESLHLSQFDEAAFFERAQDPSYSNTFLTRIAVRAELASGARRYEKLIAGPADTRDENQLWRELAGDVPSPPERYTQNMRRLIELGHEYDFDVVLIKEPVRGDVPWLWKQQFQAAVDALGAEYGVPTVYPAPALTKGGGAKLFVDPIHPNAEGYRIVATELLPAVQKLVEARAARAPRPPANGK